MHSGVLVGAAAQDVHEAILICSEPPAQRQSANVVVAGLPFEFRETGARAMVGIDGRALWLSPAAAEAIEACATIGIVDGRLVGRTRHSEQLVRAMLAEAQRGAGAVDLLLAPANGEAPELFLQAENRSRGGNPVIAVTIRELGRDMDRLPDLTRLFGLTPTEQRSCGC
jgi:hypothetical protein